MQIFFRRNERILKTSDATLTSTNIKVERHFDIQFDSWQQVNKARQEQNRVLVIGSTRDNNQLVRQKIFNIECEFDIKIVKKIEKYKVIKGSVNLIVRVPFYLISMDPVAHLDKYGEQKNFSSLVRQSKIPKAAFYDNNLSYLNSFFALSLRSRQVKQGSPQYTV